MAGIEHATGAAVVTDRGATRDDDGRDRADAAAEQEWMRAIAAGDEEAFARLFRCHQAGVRATARHMTGSECVADDVVQETFALLWRRAHRFDAARGSLATYVLVVARSQALSAMRRVSRQDRHLVEMTHEADVRDADVLDIVLQRDEIRRCRDGLRTLPVAQSAPISLCFLGGLSHTEVASVSGVPLGTVKSRVRLGLARLRASLDPASGDCAPLAPEPLAVGAATAVGD